jgi:hypothetical protein
VGVYCFEVPVLMLPQRFNFVAMKLRGKCIFSMATTFYTPQKIIVKKAACILPQKISEPYVSAAYTS